MEVDTDDVLLELAIAEHVDGKAGLRATDLGERMDISAQKAASALKALRERGKVTDEPMGDRWATAYSYRTGRVV